MISRAGREARRAAKPRLVPHALRIALPTLALALSALWAGEARADCAPVDGDIKAAIADKAFSRFDALYDAMMATADCPADDRARIGRLMARAALAGMPRSARLEAIKAVLRFGRPWQALIVLGDAEFARRHWTNAVMAYQEALDDMRDAAANPKPPPAEVESRVYKRAIEARALAPGYVPTREQGGRKSGLASPAFRNFTAESVPVPVDFERDTATLTGAGSAAVADIYAYVKDAAPGRIVIVGHTDPRGSDNFNYGLSERRAEAVKAYLVELGYAGTVETEGRGASEPFAPDDASKYTKEQLYAFDRRIEYRIAAAP